MNRVKITFKKQPVNSDRLKKVGKALRALVRAGVTHPTVINWTKNYDETLSSKESVKFNFQDDFQIPIYNVWKQQTKSNNVSHFGNSEQF